MSKVKTKKATLSALKVKAKEYDKKVKVEIEDVLHLYIYPNFKPNKIKEMVLKTLTELVNSQKENVDLNNVRIEDWLYINILTYFSDLDIPNEINGKKEALDLLLDLDILEYIIAQYPIESIKKLENKIMEVNKNMDMFNSMTKEQQEMLLEQIKNDKNIGEILKENLQVQDNKLIQ